MFLAVHLTQGSKSVVDLEKDYIIQRELDPLISNQVVLYSWMRGLKCMTIIVFSGRCNLTHNSVGIAGGAIYACAIESTLGLHGGDIWETKIFHKLTVAYNEANDSGGGIHLVHSTFVSHDLKLGSIAN